MQVLVLLRVERRILLSGAWIVIVLSVSMWSFFRLRSSVHHRVYVFGGPGNDDNFAMRSKQQLSFLQQSSSTSSSTLFSENQITLVPIFLDLQGQRDFVQRCDCGIERFDNFLQRKQEHLAHELFKYCALQSRQKEGGTVVAYLDVSSSALVVRLQDVLARYSGQSLAVLGRESIYTDTIHGSLLVLQHQHTHIAEKMVDFLVQTAMEDLMASPLLIARKLYSLIVASLVTIENNERVPVLLRKSFDNNNNNTLGPGRQANSWFFLEQKCQGSSKRTTPYKNAAKQRLLSEGSVVHACPASSSSATWLTFCCSVHDSFNQQGAMLVSRYPLLPYQTMPQTPPQPLHSHLVPLTEIPFLSTVAVQERKRPDDAATKTPNLYDIIEKNRYLPSEACSKCLRLRKCQRMNIYCTDGYIQNICRLQKRMRSKFVAKVLTVTPPLYRHDPTRLIPRLIHQTFSEVLTKKEYPNMSRLQESWRKSGWEYKFYTDEQAAAFIRAHFPPEVLEAYHALIPGALKADLFRYCVLLIYGGVYADVDVLLESNLDLVVKPDIGFMVPMDLVS